MVIQKNIIFPISEQLLFEQLKEMELYDFNQDLIPTRKLLESYLAQYKEKNSNYSDNINKDLAYLSAHYPRTIEEYNLIKKELEQKKIEKENALKLDDIKRNFESGNYYVVSDMVNSFPKNTKYEARKFTFITKQWQITSYQKIKK